MSRAIRHGTKTGKRLKTGSDRLAELELMAQKVRELPKEVQDTLKIPL